MHRSEKNYILLFNVSTFLSFFSSPFFLSFFSSPFFPQYLNQFNSNFMFSAIRLFCRHIWPVCIPQISHVLCTATIALMIFGIDSRKSEKKPAEESSQKRLAFLASFSFPPVIHIMEPYLFPYFIC